MQKAQEIVQGLLRNDEARTYAELEMKLDGVLANYRNSLEHDPSMERELYKHLTRHDEL